MLKASALATPDPAALLRPSQQSPAALTPLVGRHAELARLEQLLASNDVRLVSIVGPGGMGKTRLSLAAAQQQVEMRRFSHGVFFAELAPLTEPEHSVNVVAEAIRLPYARAPARSARPGSRLSITCVQRPCCSC